MGEGIQVEWIQSMMGSRKWELWGGLETGSGNLEVDWRRYLSSRITHGMGSLRVKKGRKTF